MDKLRLSRSHPDEQDFARLEEARMIVSSGEMGTQDKGGADDHQVSHTPSAWPGTQSRPLSDLPLHVVAFHARVQQPLWP